MLQQPIETLTYYARGTAAVGGSEAYVEVTGSKADSAKRFSHNQLSSNTTSLPIAYPLNSLTKTTYDSVFNSLRSAFSGNPAQVAALDARYGLPIAFRYRCIPCDVREYTTESETFRVAGGIEGPLPFDRWDYRVGASYATSSVTSQLGTGYHYRGTLSTGASDPNAPIAPGATAPGLVGLGFFFALGLGGFGARGFLGLQAGGFFGLGARIGGCGVWPRIAGRGGGFFGGRAARR